MSTPLQFAKEHCANFEKNGSCAGIGIRDNGSLFMFGKKPSCVLTDRKARCPYFEECVLPMGIDPVNARNVIRAQQRQKAIKLYSVNAPRIARSSGRLCPDCRRREVDKGHQRCYVCQEKRTKTNKRDHMRKMRSDVENPHIANPLKSDT